MLVRAEGSGLPIPRLDVHDTFHVMLAFAEYLAPRCACDGLAYSYVQSLVVRNNRCERHGVPGPMQRDSALPSPGEYDNRCGFAVTVTEIGPAGVDTHAVARTGFQTERGTQNHISEFTTTSLVEGAVRTNNILMARETLELAESTIFCGASFRTQ